MVYAKLVIIIIVIISVIITIIKTRQKEEVGVNRKHNNYSSFCSCPLDRDASLFDYL